MATHSPIAGMVRKRTTSPILDFWIFLYSSVSHRGPAELRAQVHDPNRSARLRLFGHG